MNYARCGTCKHSLDVSQTSTGREYFRCMNIKCPGYGPQDWVPEPLHEEVSRHALYAVALLLVCALGWIAFDKLEGRFRHETIGRNGSVQTQAVSHR